MIMVALAWFLDRARKVPNLFVDTSEVEVPIAAVEPAQA
jgi:hypothetical protein